MTPTHCKNGHPFTEENRYRNPGRRGSYCKVCHREEKRKPDAWVDGEAERNPVPVTGWFDAGAA